ncbi:MAG: DUF1887 family CARF protein [Candidatus Sumerlaeaceae bacterium]|nr:DUF1887 family CARF protein [Candidatus Sumerlaeaceae bacterium]
MRQKVLICLLSDQPIPNLLSIHAIRPDFLCLLVTERMRKAKAAKHLLKALEEGDLYYAGPTKVFEEPIPEPDSIEATRAALTSVEEKFRGAEWHINVTGGTKPMAFAAFEWGREKQAHVFYYEVSKPGLMRDLCGAGNHSPSPARKLSCLEFLKAYGHDIKPSSANHAELAEWFFPWAKALAREPQHINLRALTGSGENNEPLFRSGLLKGAFEEEVKRRQGAKLPDGLGSLVKLEGTRRRYILDKPTLVFLQGAWLEYLLYCLLKKHQGNLGIWDLRLKTAFGTDANDQGNELDLMFMMNYALCGVECKTGTMSSDKSFDAMLKLEAVMAQWRALLRRTWFVTSSDTVYDPDSETKPRALRPVVERRSRVYGCRVVAPHEIKALAAAQDDSKELELLQEIFAPAGN